MARILAAEDGALGAIQCNGIDDPSATATAGGAGQGHGRRHGHDEIFHGRDRQNRVRCRLEVGIVQTGVPEPLHEGPLGHSEGANGSIFLDDAVRRGFHRTPKGFGSVGRLGEIQCADAAQVFAQTDPELARAGLGHVRGLQQTANHGIRGSSSSGIVIIIICSSGRRRAAAGGSRDAREGAAQNQKGRRDGGWTRFGRWALLFLFLAAFVAFRRTTRGGRSRRGSSSRLTHWLSRGVVGRKNELAAFGRVS